jgi:hypothetical protein
MFDVLSCGLWCGYNLAMMFFADIMPVHQHHKKHHASRKKATASGNIESDDHMSNGDVGSDNGDHVSEIGDQESEGGEHTQPPSPLSYEALRERSPSPQISGLCSPFR